MRIAILDDEKQHIKITRKIVEDFFENEELVISCYETKSDFDKAFEATPYLFDIILLDICLPESDGIEVAKEIRRINERCRIIFLSSYLEFATEVYETEHTFYVLKSEAAKRLPVALKKAVRQLEKSKKETITVRTSNAAGMVIAIDDIMYIEKERRKTILHTTDGSIELSGNFLDEINKGKNKRFFRCYRSLWVNPSYIRQITAVDIILNNLQKIPLSRSYAKDFRRDFMTYVTDGDSEENEV